MPGEDPPQRERDLSVRGRRPRSFYLRCEASSDDTLCYESLRAGLTLWGHGEPLRDAENSVLLSRCSFVRQEYGKDGSGVPTLLRTPESNLAVVAIDNLLGDPKPQSRSPQTLCRVEGFKGLL